MPTGEIPPPLSSGALPIAPAVAFRHRFLVLAIPSAHRSPPEYVRVAAVPSAPLGPWRASRPRPPARGPPPNAVPLLPPSPFVQSVHQPDPPATQSACEWQLPACHSHLVPSADRSAESGPPAPWGSSLFRSWNTLFVVWASAPQCEPSIRATLSAHSSRPAWAWVAAVLPAPPGLQRASGPRPPAQGPPPSAAPLLPPSPSAQPVRQHDLPATRSVRG